MGIFRTMITLRSITVVTAIAAALCAAFLLGGCGKVGMPSPKNTQDTFAITGASLSAMDNCVVARGTVTGAARNVEILALELAPINSYDDCPGCPFMAREHVEFSDFDAQVDHETGQFMFSHCPADTAPMYRWRLVGKNVFRGLPYATTTPQILVMPEQ